LIPVGVLVENKEFHQPQSRGIKAVATGQLVRMGHSGSQMRISMFPLGLNSKDKRTGEGKCMNY
jgi:hypothetical protein